MTIKPIRRRSRFIFLLLALTAGGALIATQHLKAQGADQAASLQTSFATTAKPFFEKNCMSCHKGDTAPAALRVDRLTGAMEEQQMATWERVYRRVANGTMPP